MVQNDISFLKRNFFNTAVADIYRALDGKSIVGGFILTFCLIEYLNWIEFGEVKRGFNNWVIKRLIPLNALYKDNDEELYSIRNGLVHSYGPSKKMTERVFSGYILVNGSPENHLVRINNENLHIDLYSFLCDTVFAAHQLFEELKLRCPIKQYERLSKQIIVFNQNAPFKFSDMHSGLSSLDKINVNLSDIKSDYTRVFLMK